MMIVIPTYTSIAEVKRLFSSAGVNARLDDVCELQKVLITGTPTSGTYTLTYSGATSAPINFTDYGPAVQGAVREIDALSEAEVISTLTTPNFAHRIKFVNVTGVAGLLTATDNMSGGTHAITISEIQAGDSSALSDCIIEACEEINRRLFKSYSVTALGASPQVNRWATLLAAYYLSERRGNPKLFSERAERIFDDIDAVATGRRGQSLAQIPKRRSLAPVWDNQRADSRYRWKVLRNEVQTSSQQSSTQSQNVDYESQFSVEY